MTDVEEVRRALRDGQRRTREAADARVRAAGAQRRAEQDATAAARAGDDAATQLAERARESALRLRREADVAYRDARGEVAAGLDLAVDVVDPRRLISGLSSAFPVVLFPVRLETRFGAAADPQTGGQRAQLWVRVFPDTVSIDTFGAELTDSEVVDARAYWAEVWAAAGDEAGERAAWHRLVRTHGSGRGAWIGAAHRPNNEAQRPRSPADPPAEPAFDDIATAPATWNRAPRAALLPERFVFVTESDGVTREHLGRPVPPEVFTGPDPLAPPDDQLNTEDGVLTLPDQLEWLTDFDRAVHDGLGMRIDLDAGQAGQGFDRVYVVGVRVLDEPDEGAAGLEELLRGHRHSGSGLSLIPQGTPTNNTEVADSGRSRIDDPDASFTAAAAGPVPTAADPIRRRDGQWFADLLGIDIALLEGVPGAHGKDQTDARAMQALLWPATMGYLLGTQLEPVFSDAAVENTRWFFVHHVRGRGSIPAFRVGRQPYGITTTTAFSRMNWLRARPQRSLSSRPVFLTRLHSVLEALDADWDALVTSVPALGRGGDSTLDAHETLLGVLGLHPASAEFHYRAGQSIDELLNIAGLGGWAQALFQGWSRLASDAEALALLRRLGYAGDDRPPLLDLTFHGAQSPLKGPLIDDRALSETEPIRVWASGDRNYLEWLNDTASTSLDALRAAAGFVADAPNALLFLLARHALILGYAESSWRLAEYVGHDADSVRAQRREPAFVHVARDTASESRFAALYRNDPLISPGENWTVAAQIARIVREHPSTHVLRDQLDALDLIEDASTARLERALVEHLDTVTYRLDAWRLGLVNMQLETMRGVPQDDVEVEGEVPATTRGVHVGAYGWLEDVRPNRARPVPVRLPADLAEAFEAGAPLVQDPRTGGHLLAPSLNQAVTAAVLRNGYLADATREDPQAMAVNLSSERVRRALEVLSGMRQGQSLAELLGFAFERGLHDASTFAEADEFIYDLRLRFPLRSAHLRSTAPPAGTPIEAIEARNVIDGLSLVDHVEKEEVFTYPFGLPDAVLRPGATPAQRAAVEREVAALRDLRDAVGDLALAEAVHQATQGSADRAGAALRTVETGQRPPEIEVVRTPATGVTVTHRVGIHLDPAAAAGAGATPRVTAEPAIDLALRALLPPLASIACIVTWTDPVSSADESETVTLADLGLGARDVVELVRTADQGMTELDDRIVARVRATRLPRADAILQIGYRAAEPGQLPIFEVSALCDHLRSIVTTARALRPSDVVPPGEANTELDAVLTADPTRLTAVHGTLTTLLGDVDAFLALWMPRLADLAANRALVLDETDDAVDDAAALLERGSQLAVPGSGWGQSIATRGAQYARTIARVAERLALWEDRLAAIEQRLTDYAALPVTTPDAERFAALAVIEGAITSAAGGGLAAPAATPLLQLVVVEGLRDNFATRADGLRAFLSTTAPGLSALRTALLALLPVSDVDASPFEVDSTEEAMIALVQDVVAAVGSLRAALAARDAAAINAFAAHAAATDAPAALVALESAAKALLGEGFHIVPTFTLPAPAAAEWAQARADQGGLLAHLVAGGRDLPVEDWLHSAARVREPVRHLEQASLLAGALTGVDPSVVPIQLPYRAGDAWLAMEYPPTQDLASEHLLYTALYPAGFDPTASVCGLLLDAWTEVLPSDSTTIGLAFHYDQPSSEAPQSLLLVTPATEGKTWTWEDLRQAVPDTMRLARQRAVEPTHLDDGVLARFLPATITALTARGVSIGLSYALNNLIYLNVEDDDG